MRNRDTVLDENFSYRLEDAYSKIFECVDENGIFCVQDFPNGECETEGYLSCNLNITEESKSIALQEFKSIMENILLLAKLADVDGTLHLCELNACSEEMMDTFYTYIAKLDIGTEDYDEIDRLHNKWLEDVSFENFSAEEMKFMEKYKEAEVKDAEKRIGKNDCALEVFRRAQRLFRLLTLNAPRSICENEEYLFLKAFIIHKFAVSVENTKK